ncbi:8643_t:CDS:2, partial [Racocetra fulgida]
ESEEDLIWLSRLLTEEKEDLTDLIRLRIKKENLADLGLIRLPIKEDEDDDEEKKEEM